MKKKFTVFYSWQSNLKKNRYFVQESLEKALKIIAEEQHESINLEIDLDRDTQAKTGSPPISDTIFNKIDLCDIFVCEVTIVNKPTTTEEKVLRLSPNPNVMIELGYAIKTLGCDRIICVCDTEINAIEELPFHLRGQRISTYKGFSSKTALTKLFVTAIFGIIKDYDAIIERFNKNNLKKLDLMLFQNIDSICKEYELEEFISLAVTSMYTDKYYLNKIDTLVRFYQRSVNTFLNESLDEIMTRLVKLMERFASRLSVHFFLKDDDKSYLNYLTLKADGGELTEEQEYDFQKSMRFFAIKNPKGSETWDQAHDRIDKMQNELNELGNEIMATYKELIIQIKKLLL